MAKKTKVEGEPLKMSDAERAALPALDPTASNDPAEFVAVSPAALTDRDVQRLDFDALISVGLNEIDAMDDGLTKSGALADARLHLEKARGIVSGVKSGRIF